MLKRKEPGSEPLLAWKRANWVQETCLLIQATLLRTASRFFHRGLHECFDKEYEHLFDVPQHSRTDNDVLGLSPIYTRPPVDNVISCALSPAMRFYIEYILRSKRNIYV